MIRLLVALVVSASGLTFAQGLPDAGFAYSGVILDQGAPTQAQSATVGLSLWSVDGTPLCSISESLITLQAGRFSLPLANCGSVIANNVDYEVQLSVNRFILPRTPVRAVPSAARAAVATKVLGSNDGWIPVPFGMPNWSANGPSQCRRIGDTVFLNISVLTMSAVAWSGLPAGNCGVLPPICRPQYEQTFPAFIEGGTGSNALSGVIFVRPNGDLVCACPSLTFPFCTTTGLKVFVASVVFQGQ